MTTLDKPERDVQTIHDFSLKMPGKEMPGKKDEITLGSVLPSVERTDISFEDVPEGKVRIRVTVHNRSTKYYSRPTMLRLESAPFGAFVPWRPVTEFPVRALKPGESLDLITEVPRPHPTPLGSFDRVRPKALLRAVNSPDQSSTRLAALLEGLALLAGQRSLRKSARGLSPLPPDLLELLGRANPYWAGNLNVFIGSSPVERHVAKALRIYPGRTNIAVFMVGDMKRRDAYAFEVLGLRPGWEAKLHDGTNNKTLVVGPSDVPVRKGFWVEANGSLIIVLAVCPPPDCREGKLQVHVTRRSCGKTAIVEFNLDPAAQGSGCYVL